MTMPTTISFVSPRKTSSPRPPHGREIAARRMQLGKSGTDIDNETDSVIYPKLLSRIETGIKHPREITVEQLEALLTVLEWTPKEFSTATGIDFLPIDYASKETASTVVEKVGASGLRSVRTFRVTVSRSAEGELMRLEDEPVPLDVSDDEQYEIYRVMGEGINVSYVARKQTHARQGHMVVCAVPDYGTIIATIKALEGKLYVLEDLLGRTIPTDKLDIFGVVVFEQKRIEEPTNGLN